MIIRRGSEVDRMRGDEWQLVDLRARWEGCAINLENAFASAHTSGRLQLRGVAGGSTRLTDPFSR